MSRFASETTVSVAKTRAEIESILTKYGVVERAFIEGIGKASIQFRSHDRMVRFVLPLPDPKDKRFVYTGKRQIYRDEPARLAAWEQACRQKWRALCLAIKAKLEAVESGIATFEEEFLAYVVMPSGETVGDLAIPHVVESYKTGKTIPLLGFKSNGQ